MRPILLHLAVAVSAIAPSSIAAGEDQTPWPADVPGWTKPAPGEHPRLVFRRSELDAIRAKAKTEEGQRIVARLRLQLGGGEAMPEHYNPKPDAPEDGSGEFHKTAPWGTTFTLWHAAGFGMLWQLTGERKYADLGRQCVEKMLAGQRDRDNRYAFKQPHGALRAGPSLSSMAWAYDLNYDGWDEAFRTKVALAMQDYNEGQWCSLAELTRGARHEPGKNHWGGQVGGAALALLAIRDDPGVDMAKVGPLLETSITAMRRHLEEGWSAWGYYGEGDGPGGIASDTAYVPAMQAWRVAGGKDFVTPRPHASWILLRKVHTTYLLQGKDGLEPWYMCRNKGYGASYGVGNFSVKISPEGTEGERVGLSRGGQFAQGFGAIDEKYKPAVLWFYNHIVEPDPASRTYDTVSFYPHRGVLALVNWPIGMQEENPEKVVPRVLRHGGPISVRNGWTGVDDCGVSLAGLSPNMAWGLGIRSDFSTWGGATASFWEEKPDGSIIFSNEKGKAYIAVDFSKASGAEMLVALAGKARGKDADQKGPNGASMLATTHGAGGQEFQIRTFAKGTQPERVVEGDAVKVGRQTVKFDGTRFVLGTW